MKSDRIEGPLPPLPVVFVRWHDSVMLNHPAWRSLAYADREAATVAMLDHDTVGFVIRETDDYIHLTHSHRGTDLVAASITIPKCSIIEIERWTVFPFSARAKTV